MEFTQKQKQRAHGAVGNAVAKGILEIPSVCSSCGECADKIEAHHEDYSKPLDVVWLCFKCHRSWHKKHGTSKTTDVKTVNVRLHDSALRRLKIRAVKEGKTLMKLLDELSR